MPIDYVLARLVRRFLPATLVRTMLRRGWIIKPGLETSAPGAAADRYEETLRTYGETIQGKCVFVLGYGGYFGIAVELLSRGAAHVVLCDPFAIPDERMNRRLLPTFGQYLMRREGKVLANPDKITLVYQDVREVSPRSLPPADLVLSSSVYEHLDDPKDVTRALARLTSPEGVHLHFVDLRDHYFKYPFEMLCYSENVWRRWLNPPSNLNRLRIWDYTGKSLSTISAKA